MPLNGGKRGVALGQNRSVLRDVTGDPDGAQGQRCEQQGVVSRETRPVSDDRHEALRGVAVPDLGAVAGGGQGRREDFVHGAHDRRRVMRVDQPVRAWAAVTGRSVLVRRVRQGTRSTVVPSCTPPESVSTRRAPSMSYRKSR